MQPLKITSVTLKIIFSTLFSENIITFKTKQIFFFTIHNNGSFETPKNKSKQLKNSTLELENYIKEINISINGMDSFKKRK